MQLYDLLQNPDLNAIEQALQAHPELANTPIPLEAGGPTAHPLHRICDGVISGKYSDEFAAQVAKLLLKYGADVHGGNPLPKQDSPLVAAASLHADQVAMLYIEAGAKLDHPGCHGGTALHWAAWCGRPNLVKKLIAVGAPLEQLCFDFKSTPLFWAAHGLRSDEGRNLEGHRECIKLLVAAGADKVTPNFEGYVPRDLIEAGDVELREVLS